jgi:hypothetical protein
MLPQLEPLGQHSIAVQPGGLQLAEQALPELRARQ